MINFDSKDSCVVMIRFFFSSSHRTKCKVKEKIVEDLFSETCVSQR